MPACFSVNMPRRAFLSALFTLLLPLNTYAADAGATPSLPEQQLERLKQSDGVLPPGNDAHPIHTVFNPEAVIPPQCYTRTDGQYNPCYVCHQNAIPERENVMNDFELQIAYSFSDAGLTNHWQNLFEQRQSRVTAISDEAIDHWVNTDNYSELPERLRDSSFDGWVPDLKNLQLGAAAFDENGFARDGSHWVAFNYKPFPSTFWPTNGSTDDVMIRLPAAYRTDSQGHYSRDIYAANLAILEAVVKGKKDIGSLPVNEKLIGIDLNNDGELSVVTRISAVERYVGAAAAEPTNAYLYPAGTEFLHTVRYLSVDSEGGIAISPRMKEVRYMKKWKHYSKPIYARNYQLEHFEKEAGNLPHYHYLGHKGLDNKFGWSLHSFIENREGRLRENSYEENMFCMGCHTSIGSTIDKTFSFARKVDGANGWGYINLKGMPDAPNQGELQGEILTYLQRVGGGSEFRNNDEMAARWFTPDGQVDVEKVKAARDVYELIAPSPQRARALNKAYRLIVEDQDFVFGRDAILAPPANVYREVDNDKTPPLPGDKTYSWDIRLDWSHQNGPELAQP